MFLSRIIAAFTIYRGEKRSWLPLTVFYGLSALLVATGSGIPILGRPILPFAILGIDFNIQGSLLMRAFLALGLWILPLFVYIVSLCRKKLKENSLSWKDAAGAILWIDRRARTYCALMLIAVGALYVGLSMDMRMGRFACIVLPTLSLYLLSRHYQVKLGQLWLMVPAMLLFYYAQLHVGLWRIGMIVTSVAVVCWFCAKFYRTKHALTLSVVLVLYHGHVLPTMIIGNNPLTCLNYCRPALYTLDSYPGILIINDPKTDKMGLRDRHGLLIAPEYDNFVYHDHRHYFGKLELRRNGYYDLYDICNNKIEKADEINHQLQDSLCILLEDHMKRYGYAYDDRKEVKVTDYRTSKILAYVKVNKNGGTMYYNYNPEPYIPTDSISQKSGEFKSDSLLSLPYCQKQALSYSLDVKLDSVHLYNIMMTTGRDKMSAQDEVKGLSDKIEGLLRK